MRALVLIIKAKEKTNGRWGNGQLSVDVCYHAIVLEGFGIVIAYCSGLLLLCCYCFMGVAGF